MRKGAKQYEQVTPAMIDNPALREMVERFERESDNEISPESDSTSDTAVMLPPEVEQFLNDISQSGSDSSRDDLEERGE